MRAALEQQDTRNSGGERARVNNLQDVKSMNLGFTSKLMRSLFARMRHAVESYVEYYVESSAEPRVNEKLIMLRLSRCPGILPYYGHYSVMIKW